MLLSLFLQGTKLGTPFVILPQVGTLAIALFGHKTFLIQTMGLGLQPKGPLTLGCVKFWDSYAISYGLQVGKCVLCGPSTLLPKIASQYVITLSPLRKSSQQLNN